MRILILKDQKINNEKLSEVLVEFRNFWKKNCGIAPRYTVQEHDYSNVSGIVRHNFDTLPYGYLDKHVKEIHNKDNYAFDHIIFLVHRNNISWEDTGIWGENFTNFWWNYNVSICQWDHKNSANTLGTLFHEMHHGFDAFIQTMTGKNIEKMIGVKDWDSSITHGGEKPWTYIRSLNDNVSSIQYIAPLLKEAYAVHEQRYLKEKIKLLSQVVQLLQQLRGLFNKSKNICRKCH